MSRRRTREMVDFGTPGADLSRPVFPKTERSLSDTMKPAVMPDMQLQPGLVLPYLPVVSPIESRPDSSSAISDIRHEMTIGIDPGPQKDRPGIDPVNPISGPGQLDGSLFPISMLALGAGLFAVIMLKR